MDIKRAQIIRNATFSVTQVLVASATLFLLYGFLLRTIGLHALGIWSIVLPITSLASIGAFGFAGSVVKFVAKYSAHGDDRAVLRVIDTTLAFLGPTMAAVALAAYPIGRWWIALVVPDEHVGQAVSILPYTLLALLTAAIASVFQAALDGHHRIDLRNLLMVGANLAYLALAFALVPLYGLKGLAYAYLAQSLLALTASWAILKSIVPCLTVIPKQWDQRLFREMLGYGLNFQVVSLSQILYDPITKSFLAAFGGLGATAVYEMASRLILQIRALLVTTNQVLVPTIAHMHETDKQSIRTIYKESYSLMFGVGLMFFSGLIAFTPILSHLWIGHYDRNFVLFAVLLALGWFLNALSAPAYFSNLGTGHLRWNTIGHITIGAINLFLGSLLGLAYGGTAVVVGWVISLIIGSSLITISYHYRHRIRLSKLVPKENFGIGVGGLAAASICLFLYYFNFSYGSITWGTAFTVGSIFIAIVSIPIWRHLMWRRTSGWLSLEGSVQIHEVKFLDQRELT